MLFDLNIIFVNAVSFHQAEHMNVCREISGLDPCKRALTCLFHFVADFLICRGRIVVWEVSIHHAVLQVEEM